jgi:hypothetical protein
MYDYYMEHMWVRQEEEEMDQMVAEELRAHEAWEQREYERWLEEQYFAAMEIEEYEHYRATD